MQASTVNEDVFFLQARQLFEEIVDWLSSESVCGLEHGELFVNGNELLRGHFFPQPWTTNLNFSSA